MISKPRIHNGEKIVSSINSVGKTRYLYEKEQNWTLISHHTQKSKWNDDTNVIFYVFNSYTVKVLNENIEKLLDIDLGNDIWGVTPKAQQQK